MRISACQVNGHRPPGRRPPTRQAGSLEQRRELSPEVAGVRGRAATVEGRQQFSPEVAGVRTRTRTPRQQVSPEVAAVGSGTRTPREQVGQMSAALSGRSGGARRPIAIELQDVGEIVAALHLGRPEVVALDVGAVVAAGTRRVAARQGCVVVAEDNGVVEGTGVRGPGAAGVTEIVVTESESRVVM